MIKNPEDTVCIDQNGEIMINISMFLSLEDHKYAFTRPQNVFLEE